MAKAKANELIQAWLGRICQAERPPASVVAYNIGIYQTRKGFIAYLIGADRYDESSSDWACRESFSPKERERPLPGGEFANWEAALAGVVAAVRQFLASAPGEGSFLGQAKAVTVGFDDGELERVR